GRTTKPPTSSVADRRRVRDDRGRLARREHGIRDHDLDGRPLPGDAPDREPRPDLVGPCPHPGQTEVAIGDARRVEALAVVGDAEAHAVRDPAELEPDL